MNLTLLPLVKDYFNSATANPVNTTSLYEFLLDTFLIQIPSSFVKGQVEGNTTDNTDSASAIFWKSSPMAIAMTAFLLILFTICLLANLSSSAHSNSNNNGGVEAFRVGLQRRIVKPIRAPFQRMGILRRAPSDLSTEGATSEESEAMDRSSDSAGSISLRSRSRQLWNDLMVDDFQQDQEPSEWMAPLEAPDVTHFCFLIHGHRGLSKDLTYLQMVMQRVAATEKQKQHEDSDKDSEAAPEPSPFARHDMVVHSAACNEHKTTDGICNGGDRLVEEMLHVIDDEMTRRHPELAITANDGEPAPHLYNMTLSVVGNSLGGLFGRYAVAMLIDRHCVWDDSSNSYILQGKYRLHLNVFCTTATPHLGVSQHTYVKIPRTAEIGVAHALGATGKDLFRLNDLLHTMATSPTFLKPLAGFRKRMAYANAYGTDFPVPASTAAFLSENSTYPHYFQLEEGSIYTEDSCNGNGNAKNSEHGGLIIATLHTPKQPHEEEDESEQMEGQNRVLLFDNDGRPGTAKNKKAGDDNDELDKMSRSLDRLGWKKVFVDIRRELPNADLPSLWPSSLWMKRPASPSSHRVPRAANAVGVHSNEFELLQPPDGAEDNAGNTSARTAMCLHTLKSQNRVVQSHEVAAAVSSPTDNRVALPLGHNMIVAFSRSRLSTLMNKGGRPVVDALARELVEDIFTWGDDEVPTTKRDVKETHNSAGNKKQ